MFRRFQDRKFHHARQRLFIMFDADQDAEHRNTMNERNGSIDRIDDPAVTGGSIGVIRTVFLTDEAIARKGDIDRLADAGFGFSIGRGDR